MTLRLTPGTLVMAYEFLRTTAPFRGWRLPPADEIEFAISHSKDAFGEFEAGTPPKIIISARKNGHTKTLLETMAHEMCHLYDDMRGSRADHGASFRRAAHAVCKTHGFDPRAF